MGAAQSAFFSPGYILALDVKQRVGIEAFTRNPAPNSTRESRTLDPAWGIIWGGWGEGGHVRMRGWDAMIEALSSCVSCEAQVPLDQPLRKGETVSARSQF